MDISDCFWLFYASKYMFFIGKVTEEWRALIMCILSDDYHSKTLLKNLYFSNFKDLFANIYRTVVIVSIDLMPLWLDYVLY